MTAVSGFLAGGVASICTNPIDVIKTNLMANKDRVFDSYWKCIKFLYQEEGLRAFSRGIAFRFFHVGFMSLIFFCGYETFLRFCIMKHRELTRR